MHDSLVEEDTETREDLSNSFYHSANAILTFEGGNYADESDRIATQNYIEWCIETNESKHLLS